MLCLSFHLSRHFPSKSNPQYFAKHLQPNPELSDRPGALHPMIARQLREAPWKKGMSPFPAIRAQAGKQAQRWGLSCRATQPSTEVRTGGKARSHSHSPLHHHPQELLHALPRISALPARGDFTFLLLPCKWMAMENLEKQSHGSIPNVVSHYQSVWRRSSSWVIKHTWPALHSMQFRLPEVTLG